MQLYDLIIEITRRCNVACRHCMRGNAQNVDISNETIDNILKDVSSISTLTFTGGEPSLAVDRIRYITEQIKARGISLRGFYVVTNGKKPSIELAHALLDLYSITDFWDGEFDSTLCISQDQYHQEEVYNEELEAAVKLYKGLSFFKENDRQEKITMVIDEGRATEWQLGDRPAVLNPVVIGFNGDDEGKIDTVEDLVYINALGDVIPSCDLSFESQEQLKLGNINEQSLESILLTEVSKMEEK